MCTFEHVCVHSCGTAGGRRGLGVDLLEPQRSGWPLLDAGPETGLQGRCLEVSTRFTPEETESRRGAGLLHAHTVRRWCMPPGAGAQASARYPSHLHTHT